MSTFEKRTDLGQYVRIIQKRKWFLILPVIAATLTGGIGSFLVKPMYRCTTTIMWDFGKPLSRPLEEIVSRPTPEAQLASLHSQIQSTEFLEKVIATTGLNKNPSSIAWAKAQRKKYPDMTLEDLTQLRNVQILRGLIRADSHGGNIFRIVVDYENAQTARAIAQSITTAFVEATQSSQLDQVKAAQEFSIEQRTLYKQKLAEAEQKLEEFQRKILAQDMQVGGMDRSNLPAVESLRDRAGLEVDQARARRDEFRNALIALASDRVGDVDRIGAEDLNETRNQLLALERQAGRSIVTAGAAAAAAGATVEDPSSSLNSEISRKRQDAVTAIRSLIASRFAQESEAFRSAAERYVLADLDHASSDARRAAYQELIDDYMRKVTRSPENQLELDRLQRDVDLNRQLYDTFIQQIASAQIASAFEAAKVGGKVVVLEPPAMPLNPYKPNRLNIVLLAMVGGLMAGAVLVILLETHDASLKDPEEVAKVLEVEVLGSLPRFDLDRSGKFAVNGKGWKPSGDTVLPASWLREAYAREMPSSFEFRRLEVLLSRGPGIVKDRSFLITSAGSGEGKSTVAALFALALARKPGRRVLLIDFDLRKPALHTILGIQGGRPGVADALRTHTFDPEHVIELIPERFYFLPAGDTGEFHPDLLEPETCSDFLEQVRPLFTHVVLDTAPNIPVPDAMVLGREVDRVLFVLRVGKTARDTARWGLQLQRKARENVAGVILNDVDKVLSQYAGYRDYYSYYQRS